MLNLMMAIKLGLLLMLQTGFTCDNVHQFCSYHVESDHVLVMSGCSDQIHGSDQTAGIMNITKYKGWTIKTPLYAKLCHGA